jgi:hypothetical protein
MIQYDKQAACMELEFEQQNEDKWKIGGAVLDYELGENFLSIGQTSDMELIG